MKNVTDHPNRTIVVLGATGQQGGGVIRALAADGRWRLRAITRDPSSDAAKALASRDIEIVSANLDDPHSMRSALNGAYGVYSMQTSDQRHDKEIRRGMAIADAALDAGVSHFVYASVGGADRRSGVPHFESKWEIERGIARKGLPATIVRPTFFMENFTKLSLRAVLMALLQQYVPDGKRLQMISVDDIGKWVVRAFDNPESFIGKAEEIAGDELTREEIVAALKAKGWFAGLPFPVPRALLRHLPGDAIKMFEWFGAEGYRADIAALRSAQPDLMTFAQWLQAQSARS
ncbi:NmrA/HSCARG family protein [Hyphomicrobium nitrativorans]|nr:NmrA/HSCARG family protein [Hyphomicrobium nitrativorans]